MIVTVADAHAQLAIAHSSDDTLLQNLIDVASEAVLTYLKVPDEDSIPAGATFAARQATLILVAEFYKNREGEQDGNVGEEFGYGYLPRPVVALLYPHRDPSLA